MLLGACPARAQGNYQAQVVLRAGDPAGDVRIPADAGFQVADLNDTGHLVTVAGTPSNGALIQVADGQALPIAAGGVPTLAGPWPNPLLIGLPLKMNNQGDITFFTVSGVPQERTTYLWQRATRRITTIAQRGAAGPGGLIWADGGYFSPVLNNAGEIAFPAGIAAPPNRIDYGLFLRSAAGAMSTIALPSANGSDETVLPSIDDTGRVAYLTMTPELGFTAPNAAFLWERGATQRVAGVGTSVGGATINSVTGVWTNNANRSLLLLVQTGQLQTGPRALVRYLDGVLTPIIATGGELPGGGRLRDIPGFGEGVSWANSAGQHAFLALLEDGSQAAYLLDANGTLSLILRQGAQTSAGVVTAIAPDLYASSTATRSFGIALNGRGQVALPVRLDGRVNAVLLLTPGGSGGTGGNGGTGGPG
jgi:hypothetical protein